MLVFFPSPISYSACFVVLESKQYSLWNSHIYNNKKKSTPKLNINNKDMQEQQTNQQSKYLTCRRRR